MYRNRRFQGDPGDEEPAAQNVDSRVYVPRGQLLLPGQHQPGPRAPPPVVQHALPPIVQLAPTPFVQRAPAPFVQRAPAVVQPVAPSPSPDIAETLREFEMVSNWMGDFDGTAGNNANFVAQVVPQVNILDPRHEVVPRVLQETSKIHRVIRRVQENAQFFINDDVSISRMTLGDDFIGLLNYYGEYISIHPEDVNRFMQMHDAHTTFVLDCLPNCIDENFFDRPTLERFLANVKMITFERSCSSTMLSFIGLCCLDADKVSYLPLKFQDASPVYFGSFAIPPNATHVLFDARLSHFSALPDVITKFMDVYDNTTMFEDLHLRVDTIPAAQECFALFERLTTICVEDAQITIICNALIGSDNVDALHDFCHFTLRGEYEDEYDRYQYYSAMIVERSFLVYFRCPRED